VASDLARELRQQGITAAKAGNKDEARRLLQQSIRLEPDNEAGWLWLASVARDAQERVFCLNRILEINPNNETALKALEGLQAASAPAPAPAQSPALVKRLPNAPDTKKAAAEETARTQTPGVPLPSMERISETQSALDAIISRSLEPIPDTIKWTHKTHNRAGERDIIIYRMYVGAAVFAVLVVFAIIGVYAVNTNDTLRGVVYGPSATPTFTPTASLTPTYGLTPTPSPTPRLTSTPTDRPPNILPTSNAFGFPRATQVYPQIFEAPLAQAYQLMLNGEVPRALPTLEAERRASFDGRFDANPYYYEALARTMQGRFNEALAILEEAEGRLEERPDEPSFRALVEAGYAQAYWGQAQQALENGNPDGAAPLLEEMQTHAEAAIERDFRIIAPYLVLVEANVQRRRLNDALEVVNAALIHEELAANTVLIMTKAQLLFEQGDAEEALYQAFLARYVDPSTEDAYRLQIEISMDRRQYGQAVLYAQDYLFYFPGKTEAHRLLAAAHIAEGSEDLALQIIERGLQANTDDPDTLAMLRDRADIYLSRRQYDLALADYERILDVDAETQDQINYMRAAYFAGQTSAARTTAESLLTRGLSTNGTVNLFLGRILVDSTRASDTETLQRALGYLSQASSSLTSRDDRATAQEYIARVQLNLDDPEAALAAINTALNVGDTARRRYVRAQILLETGEDAAALSDYEWVLAWSEVFPFNFRNADLETRFTELRNP